jgi:hypothetical protein
MKFLGQMVCFIVFAIYFQISLQEEYSCLYAHEQFIREPVSPLPSHQG